MSAEPTAYFLPNAALGSLISLCAIDASDSDSLFRKFLSPDVEVMELSELEELGLTIDGEVPAALRSALELLATADRMVTLSYREPDEGLAASILAGAGERLVPIGISAEGIFAGDPISVDDAIEQLLEVHFSGADRAVLEAGTTPEDFEHDSSDFQVASAMRVAAGVPIKDGTAVSAAKVEAELVDAYARVAKPEAAAEATSSIGKAVERGMLREDGSELVATAQLESDFRGVFSGSVLTVVSKRLRLIFGRENHTSDLEALSGQLSVLFGEEAAYRVLFHEERTRFVPCQEDELGVLLAVALSETVLPASLPLERHHSEEKSADERRIREPAFFDRFQLAATAAQAPTAPGGSIPALLYFPTRTMTIEVHRATDPVRVFLNADEDDAVSWTPFADGVVVTELSADDGQKFLGDFLTALDEKCGMPGESSEFWLNPDEISEDNAGVTVKTGPLSELDDSEVIRFDFTCAALRADGMIRGETFTGLAADGAGIWVLDREEADSMLFVPADCETLRSELVRGWSSQV